MTRETPPDDAQLCYVEHGMAYFTTQNLDEQWGDDWNDAPYEHNAGMPYVPRSDIGREGYEVWRVRTNNYLVEPKEGHLNSPYSVESITREKRAPWLRTPGWDERNIEVWAGASFEEFRDAIEETDGVIHNVEMM